MKKILKNIVYRLPNLPIFYHEARDYFISMKEPVITPWGFKLAGNESMSNGTFEPLETDLVRNILGDIDILVNVGANIGYYCCHALSMGKKVIAFEPIHRNVRYLCKNIKSNGWSDAEIFPLALSDSVGILEIYGRDTGASLVKGWAGIPGNYLTLVPSSTMDVVLGFRLWGKKVLVVVDIEGSEKAMLDGAKNILANDPKPIWLMEITTREHQPEGVVINPYLHDTFKCMFEAGYQAFTVNREPRIITMADVEAAKNGNTSTFDTHNFLFRTY